MLVLVLVLVCDSIWISGEALRHPTFDVNFRHAFLIQIPRIHRYSLTIDPSHSCCPWTGAGDRNMALHRLSLVFVFETRRLRGSVSRR